MASFFDIGHPCYDQLTSVKTRYLLTSIIWPYHGLKFTSHQGHLFFKKLTADKVLVFYWIVGSSRVLTPGVWLTFFLTYSLHNPLLESPWYITYIICTILVRLIRYSLSKLNRKIIAKPHAGQLHAHNWSIFWVSDPRKNNCLFPSWSVIAIRNFAFRPG